MATIDTLSALASDTTAALQGSGGSGRARAGGSAADRAQLTRDDFYKIMIGELSNQDPFEPLDNRQFLEQLASLQTLDATGRLADGIEKLILMNQLTSASGLIGREVKVPTIAVSPEGNLEFGEARGQVERVLVHGAEVRLVLDGDRAVRFEDVTEIA